MLWGTAGVAGTGVLTSPVEGIGRLKGECSGSRMGTHTILNRRRAGDAAGHVIVEVIPVNIEIAVVVMRAAILGDRQRILLVHPSLVKQPAVARAAAALGTDTVTE